MAEYGGIVGAFVYAFRRSASWVFRSYVVASVVVGLFASIVLVLGLVTWVANPTGAIGEFTLLGVIAILILVPLFAPVLVVARRRRLGDERPRVELALALAGYAFVASVYLALLISDPNDHGLAGPLAAIDDLPRIYGLVPPAIAAAVVGALAWFTR